MLHQYINSEGNKINLSEEESVAFDQLLDLMKSSSRENAVDEFESLIKQYPKLVHAVHRASGLSILYLVVDVSNSYRLAYFNILLNNGANLDSSIINKLKQNILHTYIMRDFLETAYSHAKTIELKMKIDRHKALVEQEFVHTSYANALTTESSDEYNEPVVAREGTCCVINVMHKVIYKNYLLKHHKIQTMMEIAHKKAMISEFIDLGEDKEVAEVIITAIAQTKQEIRTQLLLEGADNQVLAEIDSVLEDLSIEQILDIFLVQDSEQEQKSFAPQDYSLAAVYEFVKAVVISAEQVIDNLASLIDTIKLLENFSLMAQTSGSYHFIGGFHGGNPDDGFGDINGFVFDNIRDVDNVNHALPGNCSSYMPLNYIEA